MTDQPSTAPSPGDDTPAVRSEHSGAFLRLTTLWRRRSHFSLVFATCGNPQYRDALIERLLSEAPAVRLDLAESDPPRVWLDGAAAAARQQPGRLHICLPLDQARGANWWQQANLLRERLAEALPGVQVLWLTDADVQAAAHHAPDLWNWREAVLGFCAVPGEPMRLDLPGPRFDLTSGMAAEALRARLADIDAVLVRHGDLEPGVAHLLLEAAQAHERLGDWNRSLEAAARAVQAFEAVDDARSVAEAEFQRAVVLWRQGQSALALQRLRQVVLPVFERLGDVRSKAVTMGQIADILQARGQLDEALRIRQQEQLPVFERLGDVRGLLVSQAKIALTLLRRSLGEDRAEAAVLLQRAHAAARQLQLPEADRIARIYQQAFGGSIQPPPPAAG